MENSLAYHQDVKQSYNSFPKYIPKRNEIYPHKNLYMNESVHSGTIHKSKKKKMKKILKSINWWIYVGHPCNRLSGYRKEKYWYIIDEFWTHYAKSKKPVPKSHLLNGAIHMKYPK